MRKLFGLIGATIGGWLGWYLGNLMSLTAAYLLSVIGTGLGMYLGVLYARRNF